MLNYWSFAHLQSQTGAVTLEKAFFVVVFLSYYWDLQYFVLPVYHPNERLFWGPLCVALIRNVVLLLHLGEVR